MAGDRSSANKNSVPRKEYRSEDQYLSIEIQPLLTQYVYLSRRRLAESLPGLGWQFTWTRAAHYSSVGVRAWLAKAEGARGSLHIMRPRRAGNLPKIVC